MKEDYLHYVWKYKKFSFQHLKTTCGLEVKVINSGFSNPNAGPDFFNSKIKIGDTVWAGNVEIHIQSSDWEKHFHHKDEAYNNTILHVVYQHDKDIVKANQQEIFTLELKNHITKSDYDAYQNYLSTQKDILCESQLPSIDEHYKMIWMEQLLVKRMEKKSEYYNELLQQNTHDWEKTFFVGICRSFGMKVNQLPFEMLANSIPYNVIIKHTHNVIELQALLFGQAGFLEEQIEGDSFYNQLKKEYFFLKHKYQLKSLSKSIWKFSKLRPQNFPTIRIAQVSAIMHRNPRIFRDAIDSKTIKELISLFDITTDNYWETHYQFGKESSESPKNIGLSTSNSIIINTIAPIRFSYAKFKGDESLVESTIELLYEVPFEKNNITKLWEKHLPKKKSAVESQGVIQLHKGFCEKKKCLECAIGLKIFNKE